ncbi:DUF2380 domain-containing protein [Methylotenera versatilis]|uniref:DUF2380 domain-containing protein n=1 Tax=Methylotenera versatilis TaxID=1055487 RepID=UPI00068F8C91|nr:DUF2380 domain-containing protein [Methylotenera versatilis]
MKYLTIFLSVTFSIIFPVLNYANAAASSKVMVLDFQLNDLTDLPNAPQELERISYLTKTYKEVLEKKGVNIVPVADKLKADIQNQSPTYLFDQIEYVAEVATESGADYALINVALKPTYLFVYPRILLVDAKLKKVVLAKAFQLESSWTDQNTTANTAKKMAEAVAAAIKSFDEKK